MGGDGVVSTPHTSVVLGVRRRHRLRRRADARASKARPCLIIDQAARLTGGLCPELTSAREGLARSSTTLAASGPQLGTAGFLGSHHRSVTSLGGLRVGPGSVSCPQPPVALQRLAVITHQRALVDVEKLDGLKQLSRSLDESLPNILCSNRLINDQGNVLLDDGEA